MVGSGRSGLDVDMEEPMGPQILIYSPGESMARSDDQEPTFHEPQIREDVSDSEPDKDSRKVPDYLYSNAIPMVNDQNVKYVVPQVAAYPVAYSPQIISNKNANNQNQGNALSFVMVPRVQLGFNVQGQTGFNFPGLNLLPTKTMPLRRRSLCHLPLPTFPFQCPVLLVHPVHQVLGVHLDLQVQGVLEVLPANREHLVHPNRQQQQ